MHNQKNDLNLFPYCLQNYLNIECSKNRDLTLNTFETPALSIVYLSYLTCTYDLLTNFIFSLK